MDRKLLVDLSRTGFEDYGKIVDAIKVGAVRFVVDGQCWSLLAMADRVVAGTITSHKAIGINV